MSRQLFKIFFASLNLITILSEKFISEIVVTDHAMDISSCYDNLNVHISAVLDVFMLCVCVCALYVYACAFKYPIALHHHLKTVVYHSIYIYRERQPMVPHRYRKYHPS